MSGAYEPKHPGEGNLEWQNWRNRSLGPASIRKVAYDLIRDKIIGLEFTPGEMLNDKHLAEDLQMSRTPVREALIILGSDSLVIFKPQSGTFVSPIDTEQMEHEQFVRYVMEKEMLSQLCRQISPQTVKRYAENVAEFCALSRKAEEEPITLALGRRLLELDNQFHAFAFQEAGRYSDFRFMFQNQQHMLRMRILSIMEGSWDVIIEEHEQILRALVEKDVDTMQHHLKTHLYQYQNNLAALKKKFPNYFKLN